MQDTFEWGYWVAEHKEKIKKITTICLVALSCLIWLFFVFKIIVYVTGISSTKQAEKDLISKVLNFSAVKQPQSVSIIAEKTISRSEGKMDAYVSIENPNEKWFAESFVYQLIVAGETFSEQTSFILPGETKIFVVSNVSASASALVSLAVKDTTWKKVIEPKILDRLNFEVETLAYAPVFYEEGAAQVLGKVDAEILNKSVYGFKKVQAVCLVSYAGQVVGIGEAFIDNWLSQKSESITFTWPKKFPITSSIELFISTDVISPDNLIALGE